MADQKRGPAVRARRVSGACTLCSRQRVQYRCASDRCTTCCVVCACACVRMCACARVYTHVRTYRYIATGIPIPLYIYRYYAYTSLRTHRLCWVLALASWCQANVAEVCVRVVCAPRVAADVYTLVAFTRTMYLYYVRVRCTRMYRYIQVRSNHLISP